MSKLFAVTGQNNRRNADRRAVDTEIALEEITLATSSKKTKVLFRLHRLVLERHMMISQWIMMGMRT